MRFNFGISVFDFLYNMTLASLVTRVETRALCEVP